MLTTIWVIEYWDAKKGCYVPSVDVALTKEEIRKHQTDGRWGEVPTRPREYARLVQPVETKAAALAQVAKPPEPDVEKTQPPEPELEIAWGPELTIERNMQSFAGEPPIEPEVDIPLDFEVPEEQTEPATLPPLDFTKTIPMETLKLVEVDLAKTIPLKTLRPDA